MMLQSNEETTLIKKFHANVLKLAKMWVLYKKKKGKVTLMIPPSVLPQRVQAQTSYLRTARGLDGSCRLHCQDDQSSDIEVKQ